MNINQPPASPRQNFPARAVPVESIATSPSLDAPPNPPVQAADRQPGSPSTQGSAVAGRLRAALPVLVEGSLPLHAAIVDKDYARVVDHLAAGMGVNQCDANRTTPLMLAVQANDHEIVQKLFEYGAAASVNFQDGHGNTVLHLAVTSGDLSMLNIVVGTAGDALDINATARRNMTPLHLAARIGDGDKVAVLVHSGRLRPNLRNLDSKTALHLAAQDGHVNAVRTLMQVNGIDRNCLTVSGASALHMAASSGYVDIVTMLAAASPADVNRPDGQGKTALHRAAQAGHPAAILALLNVQGINPNAATRFGDTPLMLAAGRDTREHDDVVRALLTAPGINVNQPDADQYPALHRAVLSGTVEMVGALLSHPGVDPAAALPLLQFPGQVRDRILPLYRVARGVPAHVSDAHFLAAELVHDDDMAFQEQ